MKNKLALLALSAVLFISCKEENNNEIIETTTESSFSGNFKMDAASSTFNWVGKKLTGEHSGFIKYLYGGFDVQNGKVIAGKFVLDMNSINVTDLEGDKKLSLEGHLKGTEKDAEDHFFNVAKYPEAVFNATGMENNLLVGDLTMKDITNEVKIPVTVTKDGEKCTIISEKFTIDRTKWNVKYASKSVFDDLGDKYINDEIELSFTVVSN